jgi:2-hydroxychromene-2-carboxylate isomerase
MGSHHCCVNKAAMALFQAHWVHHLDISNPEVVERVLSRAEVLGKETAREVMAQVNDQKIKDVLVGNTKEAFEGGSFGLPWFVGEFPKEPRWWLLRRD